MAAENSNSVNRSREDGWSEEATNTLIESWGKRFIDVNRGNLSQTYWKEIVNIVNCQCSKTFKTEIQCKNRLDMIKKRFKSEKEKIDESNGVFKSSWMFYPRMEFFIGNCLRYQSRNSRAVSPPLPIECQNALIPFDYEENVVPLLLRKEAMEKRVRKGPVANGEGCSNGTYLVMAAAEEEEETEEEEMGVEDGWKSLVKAVEGFGQVYERVEGMKMKQMVELEKQRMTFAKDLEVQKMKMFVDMQVQLEKTRGKRAGSDDAGLSTKRSRIQRT